MKHFQTCKPKDSATPCRQVSNECDLPEYCTGDSHNCPEDTFKLDTEKCNYAKSYCHQGFCQIDSKCSATSDVPNMKYLECYKSKSTLENENNFCNNYQSRKLPFICSGW